MKKILLLFLAFYVFIFSSFGQTNQRHLIINTTGYGFDKDAFNGINPGQWSYIQKFTNLTHNGQDAGVTAVRLHIQWEQYEPTLGNYQGAKLAQAIAAIVALKPGMKVALHFQYMRPGEINDSYLAENEIARIYDGTKVQNQVAYTCPSVFSQTAKQKYLAYVSHALNAVSAYYSDILYVIMGNGSSEEFYIPVVGKNNGTYPGFYEESALTAFRTEYLPCRYPGQTNVTWDGNTFAIANAPSYHPSWDEWAGEHGREYHRFAAWGLMKLFKEFRDLAKSKSSALKVLYYVADFGGRNGNITTLHNSTLPMAMAESDGIYSTDGGGNSSALNDKIRPLDVMKGTAPNKIACVEFDPSDLDQITTPPNGINVAAATEWMPRTFKHGGDYLHIAMHYNDIEIVQLAPIFADLKANYLTPSYTAPARQTPVTQNIFPTVFTTGHAFSQWDALGGYNYSATDLNPVSINMTDAGYWENIWSCSSTCDYNITASTSTPTVAPSTSITLTSACTGGNCSGLTYSWSGTGVPNPSTNSSVTFNAPATPGTYTYTVSVSKSGCSGKTATVQIVVEASCVFNITAANSLSGSNLSLTYSCSGANCSGVTYAWSGNGASGSTSPLSVTAPTSPGTYTYTVTASKSGCTAKTATTTYNVSGGGNPCGYVDKQTVGTWGGLNVQTRQYTVNGASTWLIVTAINGSSTDKHFPRGKNFADRGDISWTNGVINKTCLGGGETGWNGLVFPSGITVPSGYAQGTEPDGAVYFQQSCTAPSAPSLSASPFSITSGSSSTLTASGCSGGTITWSDGLGTGTSKSVTPSSTKPYTATCSIGGCTSSNASVTVTVIPGTYNQCLESESMNGTGAITSDPNASNDYTRGEENNYNHYVDYTLTGVPTAGTYYVTLQYYSSAAPTVGVQVNGGSIQTVNLVNSQSWNIVWTTQQFSVTLAAGNNTVRITGTGGGSCRQDKICVSNTSGSSAVLGIDPAEITTGNIKKAMSVLPNPNKGSFETQFYLEKGKKANIIVVDFQGRTIYRKSVIGQGLHKERINLLNKASGTLLLQLQKENGTEVKKINIVR